MHIWSRFIYICIYDQDLPCRIVETHFSAPHSIIVSAWCPSVSQFAMAEMVGGDPGETRKGFHVLSSMYLVPNTIQPVPGTAKLTVMHVAEYIVGMAQWVNVQRKGWSVWKCQTTMVQCNSLKEDCNVNDAQYGLCCQILFNLLQSLLRNLKDVSIHLILFPSNRESPNMAWSADMLNTKLSYCCYCLSIHILHIFNIFGNIISWYWLFVVFHQSAMVVIAMVSNIYQLLLWLVNLAQDTAIV